MPLSGLRTKVYILSMDSDNIYINTLQTPFNAEGNKLLVCYSGTINSVVISALFEQVKNDLSACSIRGEVLSIMTELLQNILHYCPPDVAQNKENAPYFLLEETAVGYMFTASNMIHKSNVASLEKRLSDLNNCTEEELEKRYRDILKNGAMVNESAGLGWIDIRRKSGRPILFNFTSKDNKYVLFTVSVLV